MRRQLQFSLFSITQLLRLSKIKRTFVNSPPSNCTHNTVMCLAKIAKLDTVLRPKDRVEIYRPLIADPKQVRKERAAQGKKMRGGKKA
jgi:putative ubiquitin-RnfH superfamily antitoxin RatB of RatAB toxin-antitoxin module